VATDVEGYSAIAEDMNPRELARLMDDYFAELFVPVKERGGIVLDVAGDGMLAIWTSSADEPGFRRAACHALLDMTVRVDRFNARRTDGRRLRTRTALHCGQLMLGSFGAVEHFEYRAVGDIVNTASRIDGLNKFLGTSRLVSDIALHGLDEFVARPVGSFVLAGKSRPLAVSELLGRRGEVDPHVERLARRFTEALAAYAARDWLEAAERFRAVLDDFAGDGPAAFYLSRCANLIEQAPGVDWNATVRLDAK
jgi:adenylate cyclase